MTDFGRRSGVGDMLKSVYDANDDGVVDSVPAHKASHQASGSDEMAVAGLTGTTPRAIQGDATAGRVLRAFDLLVMDGSNADTINAQTLDVFNGDAIAAEDNLGHGGDTGHFALSADGTELTIQASGLTGNCVGVISAHFASLTTGTVYTVLAVSTSNNIVVNAFHATDGTPVDFAAAADLGYLDIHITYITDA